MKIPYSWIKEYTPLTCDAENYMRQMIMTGTAVEGYEDAAGFSGVVVGKVLEVKDHENSNHLHICKVDVGNEVLQIVCGAPNVKENILVPVALVGAVMPNDFKIKKGKLRGVESFGMICSGPELGVPTYLYPSVGDEGILIFQEDYALGTDVKSIFHLDDSIIDFDILANRPDCLSVLGIAAETAAVFAADFKKPQVKVSENTSNITDFLAVEVLEKTACPRYTAKLIQNVKIGPSPLWLRAHLHKAGIRSINNIVDITNFVMLETGHPMHAFDYDKIRGKKIIVKYANEGEVFATLDEKEHSLTANDLVICDAEGTTGLAGIMGGLVSEISLSTQNVVFECAVFDRAITRKAARRLGIRTESSGRFEKGVNKATVDYAILRACQLVNELQCGDVANGMIDIYSTPYTAPTIQTSAAYIQKRTGVAINTSEVVTILERLGFTCAVSNDCISAIAPSMRQDIEQEADICEEVLRIHGFDKIPATPLRGATTQGGLNPMLAFRNHIRNMMHGFQCMETMHYSFIGKKLLDKLELSQEDMRSQVVAIQNPLGEDSAFMRTTLVPNMLQTVALNMNRGNDAARLYESSKVFFNTPKTEEGLPYEKQQICVTFYGANESFFSLRAMCESILTQLHINYSIQAGADSYYHPGRAAILMHNDTEVIRLGEVHPDILNNFGISKKVYIAELDVELLFALQKENVEIKDLPKFPAVTRDLAVVLKENVQIGPVLEDIKKVCSKILESASVFDVYRGKPIAEDSKSVAFSFSFRSADRTLTDDEIQKQMNAILKTINEKYEGSIRE